MGTPDYVAPEVLNYEPISLATDMWSVGVLTYVLLTGCSPFGGETKQDTFCNITKAIVDFPEDLFADISDNAKDFILRLLIKKPSDRMKVDECLRHPWLKCGKPEIPRPDSIPILPRQESCPACGSGNTTPVNTPSSFLNDTQQSPRGRRLSNLHPSTDSLDSDTSVETVKAAHNGTRRMIPDDEEEEEDLDGDLNASKRYSASTETVTSSSSSSSNSIGINGNRASMTTSMTSLRSPYSRRRSSMESLTPRFSASIRSIPESMIRASVAATSAEVEEDAGFEAREEEEELPIDQETIRRTEMVALYGSRSAENRKRRSSPATRFSLGHNTRLFPMLGEDDVDSPDDSVPCKNENVPSSPLKSDDDQVPTHGRCFLTAGEDTRRAFSVPAAFDPPDSEPGLLPTRLMMTAATTTTTTDAHNHSQSCCDDLSDSRGSVNVTNGGSQQRHHHPHYHHLLHFQQQQFHANNRQPQFPAPPPKESSPRLSRLSSETSSERSSGVFSDYSELSSDSSSDRSSVMSWEEAADAGSNHMGGCSAVGAPRFQNALEERFFELNLWETVWDEVALRNRRGTCPGRRGSADAHKPWEKVCSGIVARAQAQIATKSTRKAPTSAANNSSANCRSLGRSLGHTVSRSITRLHEKGQMVGPLPTTTTSTGSQDAVVQKASPKKPTRAPPMPPVAVVVVGTPCVRKLSAAFDNSSKVAHAR
ncbi:unnamed protein product [Notodromas monacha]|uniref:Protein kinase domain-containing protein n=1 Tax=Notodromas monacha TaxID=399045 RepID=A0A7R9BPI2_9CRUS|nr:unnamed protein product [Notodromas monacha]CAG0918446.1 unnamed protein product [Notodromas monacha]